MTGTLTRMHRTLPAAAAGLASGFLAFFLLLPASGIDTNPPVCYATFGYTVPCGSGLAFGVALAVSLLVGGATYRALHRHSR